jgi:hypothetical protein
MATVAEGMATIVEDMDVAAAAAGPPPAAPSVFDDATLNRLADLLQARMQPARPAWQMSLLVTLAGALIAAATAGYFSLRGDIASLGTSLRAEISAVEASLRAEISAGDTSLRAEIAAVEASLRAELQDFRDEFNMVARDHTERLTRLETVQTHHSEQLAHIETVQTRHTEQLAHIETVQTRHTEQLTRLEAAHPHPAAP